MGRTLAQVPASRKQPRWAARFTANPLTHVAKRVQTAIFFGAGVGPLIALGNVRTGAKMFGGVELFHQRTLPIQIGLELIQKFCDEGRWLKMPGGRTADPAGGPDRVSLLGQPIGGSRRPSAS